MAKRKIHRPVKRVITAKKRAGSTSPAARQRAAAAESLKIQKALAAFAHDVRTPLTGILALSELLSTSELGERERQWVLALKGTAEHLTALTTLVVDAARAEVEGIVLRHDVFDLKPFIAVIVESMSVRAAAKGLAVDSDVAGELPAGVIGDPVRLRGAVENLIDNAVKFTEAGKVSLRISVEPAHAGRLRMTLAVTDTGIGMAPAEIRRVFRPFAQANADVARRYGGAGLGLVLVKRLAEAMGGTLTVASVPGRGSTFTLTVVLTRAPAAEAGSRGDVSGAPTQACRILCAEDNPYGRVILATILKELGHSVEFVGSGNAAVTAAASGSFDLVLMDVTLPNGDGIEATRRIRALSGEAKRLPIIGVSGLSSPDEEARARAAGMNDYLAKPVSPARLAKAIAGIVAGG
jgi:two-component system, sensor histidine kinase